jgi:hypothetical protein
MMDRMVNSGMPIRRFVLEAMHAQYVDNILRDISNKNFTEAFSMISEIGSDKMKFKLLTAGQIQEAKSLFKKKIVEKEGLFKFYINIHNTLLDLSEELDFQDDQNLNDNLVITDSAIGALTKLLKNLRSNLKDIIDFEQCKLIDQGLGVIQYKLDALYYSLSELYNNYSVNLLNYEVKALDLAELNTHLEISDEVYDQFLQKWQGIGTTGIKHVQTIF